MSHTKNLAFYAARLEALLDDSALMNQLFQSQAESTQHCWYDTFPLTSDRPVVSLPLRYNDKTDSFQFEGTFCCWACCKRYNHDYKKADPLRSDRESWINRLALRLGYITHNQTVPYALPREALKPYGGTLTIEQFRQVPDSILNKYSLHKWNPRFVPIVEIEQGIVSDPSPLASVLVIRDSISRKRSNSGKQIQVQSYPKRMVIHSLDEKQSVPCTDIPKLDDLHQTMCLPGVMNTSDATFAHIMTRNGSQPVHPVKPNSVESLTIVSHKANPAKSFFHQKLGS